MLNISKKNKGILGIIFIFVFGIGIGNWYSHHQPTPETTIDQQGNAYHAKSEVGKTTLSVLENGKWKDLFIKGVNIGAGRPGYFPGEFGTTKEEYLRWFAYISNLNANTIRVYTILSPDFYEAFYEYNQSSSKPLYLIHGVWINEMDILTYYDAYAPQIYNQFYEDIGTAIDVIHGNTIIKENRGHAAGIYEKDISPYVLGYILGIEWDPQFVVDTNAKNPDKTNFVGKYIYSENANPFENFLAIMGDRCVTYEAETYQAQRPISYSNWVTTDMLNHPNEPLPTENIVSVNTEHIKKTDLFTSGLFASYHIYPYYPDSMSYQPDYASFVNSEGKKDPYEAYLKDLRKEHTVPVLVAEFGIPASRGQAHINVESGFNQGFVEESAQGEMIVSMLNAIKKENYAGGLVFAWQDEWFKRTWNTMDYDLPMRRAYWNNVQTNEQHFGLLAFDSGEKKTICEVDGEVLEWKGIPPLVTNGEVSLSVNYDDAYVYLRVNKKGLDLEKDKFLIPFDTIGNQGNFSDQESGERFDHGADFLIRIDGKENSRIVVDAYYDNLQYSYADHTKMIPMNEAYLINDSSVFSPMYLCINRQMTLPLTQEVITFQKYETGKLLYGNGNSEHKDFNSLADYYVKGDNLEIRIPWALLSFMDPSTKVVLDDLHKNGVQPLTIAGMNIGVGQLGEGKVIEMKEFTWDNWALPVIHERIKPSYYIVQKAFKKISK
ncbi:MAG: family 2 glycosyl transferase [Eubacteriaceae bacterium]